MGNEHSKGRGPPGRPGTSVPNAYSRTGNFSNSNTFADGGVRSNSNNNNSNNASGPSSAPRSVVGSSPAQPIGSNPSARPVSPNRAGPCSAPRRVTVPQVLDAKSFIYTQNNDADGGGNEDDSYTTFGNFAGVSNTADPFIVGTPNSPLASSARRVFSTTAPIPAPMYNMGGNGADDVVSVSSPVLRSYREHSFSRPESMVKSPAVRCPPQGDALTTGMSLDASAMLGSSLRGGPPVGAAGEPLHARFLEIAGVPLGLENYGNTCYLNSVIQLLYHCAPIRLRLLELQEVYASKRGGVGFEENTVLFQLCQLFTTMHKQNNAGAMNANKKQSNSSGLFPSMTDTNSSSTPGKKPKITPSEFLKCVKMNNAIFNNSMQQDAHEFVLYLLNDIIESEQKMMTDPHNRELFSDAANYRKKKSSFSTFWKGSNSASSGTAKSHKKTGKKGFDGSSTDLGASLIGNPNGPLLSPLQAIIQGTYASVTVCLECNHMTTRDEVFMDVSVGTKPGSSLTNCIQHMGDPEYFFGDNKLLKCDGCGMKQFRAAKTIHVERLPQYALLVHLKRFRYDPSKNTFSKQSHHVALPIEMDVEEYEPVNEEDDEEDADIREQARRNQENSVPNDSFRKASDKVKRKLHGLAKHKARFELAGFVAHLGEGPNSGHYFTCVRCGPQKWRRLDDENVTEMTEREVQQHFGVPIQVPGLVTSTAYILLYERVA